MLNLKGKKIKSVLGPLSATVFADEAEPYYFVGLGLVGSDMSAKPSGMELLNSIHPDLSLGTGVSYAINDDWSFDQQVSLHHTSAEARFADPGQFGQTIDGVRNTGVWTTSIINRHNLFGNDITPFARLTVGVVKVNLNGLENGYQDRRYGSRANLGLEFTVANQASIAISWGVSNYAGNN